MTRHRRENVEEVAPSPDELRVSLLGDFRVSVGGREIAADEWHLKKAKSLVKLLSLAPGHRLHRERVLDLLWPNLSLQSAANNLHRTLHAARKALSPTTDASRYLSLRDEHLTLCPGGGLRVDVEAFEEAARAARRDRDPSSYRAAIGLYAGDLLPEDLYEDWAEERRADLRNSYLDLLIRISELYEERKEFDFAIEALRVALDIEPVGEEENLALMRLYALSGRRRAALEQYERLSKLLDGAAPPESVRRMHEDIVSERFPPGRDRPPAAPPSEAVGRHNLPSPLTSFVGRGRELAEVRRSLAMNRLVTLTGAGGSGKTRLALEIAREVTNLYPDGVWLVELAPLAEGALVPQAISGALRIREKPDRPISEALVDDLRPRKLLLILDNCEHLVADVARLTETLLHSCPELRVLATSRESLGVAGEIRYPVPPLALPGPEGSLTMEEMESAESSRLFVERASYRGSTFALTPHNARTVARICQRLDGIPLAIELAAARIGTLSVEQISGRLENSLTLLTRGSRTATRRQRTLEGALEWGHELLESQEKRLFGRLSVFAGGWTLEAAEEVVSGGVIEDGDVLGLLSGLIDKSLVVVGVDLEDARATPPRYRMLEPIRQYAWKKLEECDETEEVMSRHADFFLALAEEAESELRGSQQTVWMERLDAEYENLRVALRWTLEKTDSEEGLRLAGALGEYWILRGHMAEGSEWMDAALARGGEGLLRGKVLYWVGYLAREHGDYERAEALGEESLKLMRDLGDRATLATVLYDLGLLSLYQNSYERSSERLDEALALQRELGNDVGVSLALQALGSVALARSDYDLAADLNEESLALAHATGNAIAKIFALGLGALVAVERGDHARAKTLNLEGFDLALQFGHERLIIHYLHIYAVMAGAKKRFVRAAKLWGATEGLREAMGSPLPPVEARYFEPYIRAIREALDEPIWKAAWSEGRAMSRKEATDYALSEEENPEDEATDPLPAALSPREQEIAHLIAEGFTNRRIAEVLGITKRTADTHVATILRKTGFHSRQQISEWIVKRTSNGDNKG